MRSSLLLLLLISSVCYSMTFQQFSQKLGSLESGNNYSAVNRYGYLGKYQFGKSALVDLGYKTKRNKWTCKDKICSKRDFLSNPRVQEKAFKSWIKILKSYLKSKKLYKYIGKKFKGILVSEYGLLAASHLVGAGSVRKMLRTSRIIRDGNGTKATYYLKQFEQ